MRNFEINRQTAETDIALFLELDGNGKSDIDTGCGFLDHMLTLFASHGSSRIWSGKFHIFAVNIEVVSTAKIILCTRAAN